MKFEIKTGFQKAQKPMTIYTREQHLGLENSHWSFFDERRRREKRGTGETKKRKKTREISRLANPIRILFRTGGEGGLGNN